jgi:hypothetical protein
MQQVYRTVHGDFKTPQVMTPPHGPRPCVLEAVVAHMMQVPAAVREEWSEAVAAGVNGSASCLSLAS